MTDPKPTPEETTRWQRRLAGQANNHAWQLAEQATRTSAQDEQMLQAAHAAAYFWGLVGDASQRAHAALLLAHAYATLRLPGRPGDHAARLRDLSLSGLCVQSPVPAPERSAVRVMTASFDAVAVVVGCRRLGDGWLLHGELLTLQLLRSQGVFVSAKV